MLRDIPTKAQIRARYKSDILTRLRDVNECRFLDCFDLQTTFLIYAQSYCRSRNDEDPET